MVEGSTASPSSNPCPDDRVERANGGTCGVNCEFTEGDVAFCEFTVGGVGGNGATRSAFGPAGWVAVSSIVVSELEYAPPGSDSLFFDVGFGVAPGEHAALVGANGVGKSTILRILSG